MNYLQFNEKRAGNAAAFFFHKAGEPLLLLKLLKLLYLAERESLRRYGEPMLGETFVSAPFGPMPLTAWMNISTEDGPDLTDWIGIPYKIQSPEKELLELSNGDIEILENVWDQFGKMTALELVKYTCSEACPEWEGGYDSIRPISLGRMLCAIGYTQESAQEVIDHLEAQKNLKNEFAFRHRGHA